MDSRYQGQNGILPPPPNDRFQRVIRFYSRKFHFIVIPLGIIMAIIHLKYAITYFGQCPMQPMIIIYMIVHATVHLSLILLAFIGVINIRCIYSPQGESNTLAHVILVVVLICTLVLLSFSFAWLIAGSVWIFGAKVDGVQGSDPTATTTYCQSDLFRAALLLIIINYVIHGIIILIVIYRCICRKKQETIQPAIAMDPVDKKF